MMKVPFGWAYRVGGRGSWNWSHNLVGFSRDEAVGLASKFRRDIDEPTQVAKVWVNIPPPYTPNVQSILEAAEESYRDLPVVIPEDSSIIDCTTADAMELQEALDVVWKLWLRRRHTNAVFVAEDEAEDV